jgi:hypothetical protein
VVAPSTGVITVTSVTVVLRDEPGESRAGAATAS